MKWETIWGRCKQTLRRIGEFQAHLLLSAFYFVILAPFALVLRSKHRLFSASAVPTWLPVADRHAADLGAARNQS